MESKVAKINLDKVAEGRLEVTDGHTELTDKMFSAVGGGFLVGAQNQFENVSKSSFGHNVSESVQKAAKKSNGFCSVFVQ